MPCPAWAAAATSIIIAGQPHDIGRPVVHWCDNERGFNAYSEICVESVKSRCCDLRFRRYGQRAGVRPNNLGDLRGVVKQLVLHHDGCVNSRSCFHSMHDMPRPDGGCGLSAHFMVDADGTIYQTLDVQERALHAGPANQISIGVEMCNRGDASRNELDRLPADYRTRPVKRVSVNGRSYQAFDFRPEQYASVIALTRVLVRTLPQIAPVMPEVDGKPLMATLAKPLAFRGIVGHFHVDPEQRKWDPGAFDWRVLFDALHGFYLPVALRGYDRFPDDDPQRLATAARIAYFNVEERALGSYPVGPGGVWDPGVYSLAEPGGTVRTPARGVVLAARLGKADRSKSGFVLIRHDVDVDHNRVRFYSVLGPLKPMRPDQPGEVGWLKNLAQKRERGALASLGYGETTLIGEPIESGDVVGYVSEQGRGPGGGQVRLETFTTEPLPAAWKRIFRILDAGEDGPICRRKAVFDALGVERASELDEAALERFLHGPTTDRKQALRGLAVRMPHPWGDRVRPEAFLSSPGLAGLSDEERRRVYEVAIAPNVFYTEAVARHAGLPLDQTVYFHHPLTLLYSLASVRGRLPLRMPAAELADGTTSGEPESGRGAAAWLRVRTADRLVIGPIKRPVFSAPRREDIELVVLPQLGH